MMRVEVREPPANYAEYCRLPEDAPRYEILAGVGYLTPSPGGRHQKVSANVFRGLDRFVQARQLGEVLDAPLDVVFSETDVVQPDLLYIAGDRVDILRDRGVFGPPDLAVEILSPASVRRDLQQKLTLYQRYGVREYWIIDLQNRTVDVWTSRESPLDTRRVVTAGGIIESSILPGLAMELDEIFAGIDRIAQG